MSKFVKNFHQPPPFGGGGGFPLTPKYKWKDRNKWNLITHLLHLVVVVVVVDLNYLISIKILSKRNEPTRINQNFRNFTFFSSKLWSFQTLVEIWHASLVPKVELLPSGTQRAHNSNFHLLLHGIRFVLCAHDSNCHFLASWIDFYLYFMLIVQTILSWYTKIKTFFKFCRFSVLKSRKSTREGLY